MSASFRVSSGRLPSTPIIAWAARRGRALRFFSDVSSIERGPLALQWSVELIDCEARVLPNFDVVAKRMASGWQHNNVMPSGQEKMHRV